MPDPLETWQTQLSYLCHSLPDLSGYMADSVLIPVPLPDSSGHIADPDSYLCHSQLLMMCDGPSPPPAPFLTLQAAQQTLLLTSAIPDS